MKLQTQQFIQNENYVFIFSIDPTSVSSSDALLFQKYGQQIVNFGATTATTYAPAAVSVYSSYDTTTSLGIGSIIESFNLPDCYINLLTGFTVQQVFSNTSPSVFATNSTTRLLSYRQYIQAQIYNIVTTLRDTADTFTGDFITNI